MKYFYLLSFFIITVLFEPTLFAQTQITDQSQRMVFVTYDFSGSMKLAGKKYGNYVTPSEIEEWNAVLSEVLFAKEMELRRFKSAKIIGNNNMSSPLLRSEDIVTFAEIREQTIIKMINQPSSSRSSIEPLLPKKLMDFNGQFTDIAHAELEFLKLAEQYETPVWVCISDQQQSVGSSRGGGQAYLAELVNLRYKLPTVPVLTIQLKDDVYIIVRKLSIDEKGTYLSLNTNLPELKFVQSKVNPKMFYDSLNAMMLQPMKDVNSSELKDIRIWFRVYDKSNRFVDSISFRVNSFPGTFDSLLFKEANRLLESSKQEKLKLSISARYIYKDRLVTQQLGSSDLSAVFHSASEKVIKPTTSSGNPLLWILLVVGALAAGGGLYYFLSKNKSKGFTFQAERGGVKLNSRFFDKIKEKQVIKLGKAQAGSSSDNCYDIHSPGYSVKYDGNNTFLLMKSDNPEKQFRTGQKVSLVNSEGLEIELTIFENRPKAAVSSKPLFNPATQKTDRRF